jgi:tetratricopeptide (TPR) repeat protein
MVKFELEDMDGARSDFNEAIELNATNSYAYFNRSFVYIKENKYDSALADMNRVLEIDPNNSLTFFYRAMIYTELEEINKAIDDYSTVISINPNNLMVFFNRGNLYLQSKQYKKAEEDFSQAIVIYPEMADAYANRAIARSKLNQSSLATKDYDKARQLRQDHYAKTHEELVAEEEKIESLMEFEAQFFQSDKDKEQLQNKDIDIDLLADYSIVWNVDNTEPIYTDFSLIKFGERFGLNIKASSNTTLISETEVRGRLDSLTQIILSNPDSIIPIFKRAILYTGVQNYHAAIKDYDQIIKLDSNFAPSYLNKSVIETKLVLMQTAFASSQNVSYITEDQPEYSTDISDINAIKSELKKALELMPELPYAYYNLANLYCKQQQYNVGFEYYEKAIGINPEFGEAYYNKGITMIYLGDSDNGCYYVSKSGELGIEEAYSVLKRFCNKK